MDLPLQQLVELRKELHRFPELSGKEERTAARVKQYLHQTRPDILLESLGGHGLAAVYEGKTPGKRILIRCELDALPIREVNAFGHVSTHKDISHMCGHDGHMAIVCGLATLLQRERQDKGSVVLFFQPSEENGMGARSVLGEERFLQLRPDYVFALHNLPGYPLHEIIVKKGLFTAAVNSIVIRLLGKTSHAGEPDKGINPAPALSEIIAKAARLNLPDIENEKYRQISFVHASMGEKAYGISAGDAEIGLTFRCHTTGERDKLGRELEEMARNTAASHGLKAETEFLESFHANRNSDRAVDFIAEAAESAGLPVNWLAQPQRWGEDFGLFTEKFPGALFGLGAGENTPALHNPDYDFPDEIISTGITIFRKIIEKVCQ